MQAGTPMNQYVCMMAPMIRFKPLWLTKYPNMPHRKPGAIEGFLGGHCPCFGQGNATVGHDLQP